MFEKIKKWLLAAGAAVIGILLTILHIKNKKIDTLKSDLKKSEAANKVNAGSVELLETQIQKEHELTESAESYNSIVDAFNGGANEKK